MISQLATGLSTNTSKRSQSAEKLFVSRQNSSNSKRDSSLSNTGVTGKFASLGVALSKQSFVKQPLVETESSHKSSSNSNTKDCKRRNNMAYRPSAVGNKSVSVKAAIEIFENEKFRVKSDKDLKSDSVQAKSGQNSTVVTFEQGSGRNETEHKQTKTKPLEPIKKVTKELACPQKSSAMLESSLQGPHTRQESENLQKGEKETVAANRWFLWGASLPGTKQIASLPGTNQSASVPVTNQFASVPGTNQFASVPGTDQSTSCESSNQTTSLPGTDQSTLSESSNQTTSLPGTDQSTSSESSNQTTSVPCTDHSTSVPGSTQPTSVPVVVTKHYESAKPDNFANVTVYCTDELYDDVYPPPAVCCSGTSSNHPYSMVQPQDDDVFDDVHTSINEEKQWSAEFEAAVR